MTAATRRSNTPRPTPKRTILGESTSLCAFLDRPPMEWLIEEVLPCRSFSALHGEPGSGKSLVAISIGLTVASGGDWCGMKTRRGVVVYLFGEGQHGAPKRISAWLQHFGRQPRSLEDRFIPVPRVADLLDNKAVILLVRDLKRLSPSLVIIDTLARSMVGGDENSSRDMGLVIAASERIMSEVRAAVMLLHHPAKATKGGMRGHGSLHGATDTELHAVKKNDRVTVKIVKQKDGEDGAGFRSRLTPVSRTDSVVLVPDGTESSSAGAVDSAGEEMLLDALPDSGGMGATEWWTTAGVKKSTAYPKMKSLVEKRFVVHVGRQYQVTAAGKVQRSRKVSLDS